MSKTLALVTELMAVLDREREAIRSLDGATVAAAADDKTRLATALAELSRDELESGKVELAAARVALLRNGTLLAHARSCLRDVLSVARHTAGAPEGNAALVRARL